MEVCCRIQTKESPPDVYGWPPWFASGVMRMWESHTPQLQMDGETMRSFFECCLVYGGGPCTFVDPWKQGFSAPSLNGAETQLIVARRN